MSLNAPFVAILASGIFIIAVLTTTAFVKISVVMLIIRNALGLQGIPTNSIIHTLAFVLALYVSMPIMSGAVQNIRDADINPSTIDDVLAISEVIKDPIVGFLKQNTRNEQLVSFINMTNDLWPGSGVDGRESDIFVLIPAFMISELTRAFEIGFLLYIPFVAIDLVITTILMALGMMMVPPSMISIPFKLLLFLLVGGWTKLIEGLIMSYGGAS